MRKKLTLLTAIVLLCWAGSVSALEWERITLNGYTSFEFEQAFEERAGGDPNGSFDADLFDLVWNIQVSDRIRAAADITWEHGAASEDDRGNVALEYGFVEYSFSDLARVRVGKMFTPFGVYNEIHTAKPAFLSVKEAASTNKPERIVENALRFFPRWGVGIELSGDGMIGDKSWNYNLMIANGEQEDTNPFEEDNNTSKSITGRIRLDLSDSFRVGASIYRDDPESDMLDSVQAGGIQIEWEAASFRLLGEAVFGTYDFLDGTDNDQLGFFVQPSYHLDNGLAPYLRYEWIDPDRDSGSDDGYDLIVGLNYEPTRWFMIKLESNYFKGGKHSTLAQYPGRDYNEFKAAVVLGF